MIEQLQQEIVEIREIAQLERDNLAKRVDIEQLQQEVIEIRDRALVELVNLAERPDDAALARAEVSLPTIREAEVRADIDLRRLHEIAQQAGLPPAILRAAGQAIAMFSKRRFCIAVVGEFKRGKSTLVNALLGHEILPSDVLPTSAVPTRVTYGLKPLARIVQHSQDSGSDTSEEIAIDQLANYVTKLTPESEQIASTVKEAIVYYPLSYCQNNVEIVDTPGYDHNDTRMTETTLSVLSEASAAIMVTMATVPFSQYEADFLANQLLSQNLGRIIFVVTGIDLLRKPEDRTRILRTVSDRIKTAVEKRLQEQFGSAESADFQLYREKVGHVRVFGLSAYQALEAKMTANEALLDESRFSEFEAALEKFLTEGRGSVEVRMWLLQLISVCKSILQHINEAGDTRSNLRSANELTDLQEEVQSHLEWAYQTLGIVSEISMV